jgi:kynureninase
MSDFEFSLEYARKQDLNDPLNHFRQQFHFPQHNNENCVYLTGNSLGLAPKNALAALEQEVNDWAKFGVEGHFEAKNPWVSYHEMFAEPLAELMGAKRIEVAAMNGLTSNLHLLMISFYRPTKERYKIICEGKAFPSDQYALQSQVKHHGHEPKDAIVQLFPREGEHNLRTEDVLDAIHNIGSELALVMIGGVNYYTGQFFNIPEITAAGHKQGAMVGWDLAHAAGNLPLELHDWNVDFAAWCSYKYMNSGPGSVSGIFVHEKHCTNPDTQRFAGWWGHNKERRFLMEPEFNPIPTAESWQLSNAPVLAMAVHKVSLDIFMQAGIQNLRTKSIRLTSYLEYIIQKVSDSNPDTSFEIITPSSPEERGAQLSILAHGKGKELFDYLTKEGVIADWREPNVIRIAPVPLYNSYEDVYRFGTILQKGL